MDYIACEDTRKTGFLLKDYDIKSKLIPFYDEIEDTKNALILKLLREGKDVALVSDAGTPLISDPGYKLVKLCVKNNVAVVAIPGPSSILAALVSSGLPPNNFCYWGYLSSKTNQRKKQFSKISRNQTNIFFEAPHRIVESLADLKEVCGDIEIVIARELTKIHEEIWRGKTSEAIVRFKNTKGELVILFNCHRERMK